MVEECRREVWLTARDREVLSNPALGWETRYIAEGLGVSWYTARNHIDNPRVKLGASSRLEAVMVAMRLGIPPSEQFRDCVGFLCSQATGVPKRADQSRSTI